MRERESLKFLLDWRDVTLEAMCICGVSDVTLGYCVIMYLFVFVCVCVCTGIHVCQVSSQCSFCLVSDKLSLVSMRCPQVKEDERSRKVITLFIGPVSGSEKGFFFLGGGGGRGGGGAGSIHKHKQEIIHLLFVCLFIAALI